MSLKIESSCIVCAWSLPVYFEHASNSFVTQVTLTHILAGTGRILKKKSRVSHAPLQAPSDCLAKITKWAAFREAQSKAKAFALPVAHPAHPMSFSQEIPRLWDIPTRALRKVGQHSRNQVDVVHFRPLLRECEINLAQMDGSGNTVRKDE